MRKLIPWVAFLFAMVCVVCSATAHSVLLRLAFGFGAVAFGVLWGWMMMLRELNNNRKELG